MPQVGRKRSSEFMWSTNQPRREFIARLRSFASLPAGWNYGRGVSFQQDTIDRAMTMAWTLLGLGLRRLEAFPGTEGEVLVLGRTGVGTSVEVTILAEGGCDVLIEKDGAVTVDLEMVSEEAAAGLISVNVWQKNISFGSFIHYNTATKTNVSRASPSKPHLTVRQSSVLNAPAKQVALNVNTSHATTRTKSLELHQFSCA